MGIIPAYAGSTSCATPLPQRHRGSSPHTRGAPERPIGTSPTRRDHPRIRGEHRYLLPRIGLLGGIIPAYAGSTESTEHHVDSGVDHPRIRGEHGEETADEGGEGGIIPAYAGSTQFGRSDLRGRGGSSPHTRGAPRKRPELKLAFRDHPRIRGEHHSSYGCYPEIVGIIPAYAGSTA